MRRRKQLSGIGAWSPFQSDEDKALSRLSKDKDVKQALLYLKNQKQKNETQPHKEKSGGNMSTILVAASAGTVLFVGYFVVKRIFD